MVKLEHALLADRAMMRTLQGRAGVRAHGLRGRFCCAGTHLGLRTTALAALLDLGWLRRRWATYISLLRLALPPADVCELGPPRRRPPPLALAGPAFALAVGGRARLDGADEPVVAKEVGSDAEQDGCQRIVEQARYRWPQRRVDELDCTARPTRRQSVGWRERSPS
jgi:hypothetical protein